MSKRKRPLTVHILNLMKTGEKVCYWKLQLKTFYWCSDSIPMAIAFQEKWFQGLLAVLVSLFSYPWVPIGLPTSLLTLIPCVKPQKYSSVRRWTSKLRQSTHHDRLGQPFRCPPKSAHHVLRCCQEPLSVDSIASAGRIFRNFKKKLRNPVSKALKTRAGWMLFPKLRLWAWS